MSKLAVANHIKSQKLLSSIQELARGLRGFTTRWHRKKPAMLQTHPSNMHTHMHARAHSTQYSVFACIRASRDSLFNSAKATAECTVFPQPPPPPSLSLLVWLSSLANTFSTSSSVKNPSCPQAGAVIHIESVITLLVHRTRL